MSKMQVRHVDLNIPLIVGCTSLPIYLLTQGSTGSAGASWPPLRLALLWWLADSDTGVIPSSMLDCPNLSAFGALVVLAVDLGSWLLARNVLAVVLNLGLIIVFSVCWTKKACFSLRDSCTSITTPWTFGSFKCTLLSSCLIKWLTFPWISSWRLPWRVKDLFRHSGLLNWWAL